MDTIQSLIDDNALVVVNHSGGKDSQAMFLHIREMVPATQLLVLHAELPDVDWPGCVEHIEKTIGSTPLIVCRAVKTFFEMVEHRGMWPSPKNRQCTSDLKRGPIEREVRRYLKAHPEHGGKVINAMGLRAQESASRSKLNTFKRSERNSKAGRVWYDWLPIHDWSETKVFVEIKRAGQEPHWAYLAGMKRLSCCFCIMSCTADLKTAARLRPELYQRYRDTEKRLDHTFIMPGTRGRRFLGGIAGEHSDD